VLENEQVNPVVGFAPEEIRTAEPTRAARLKWVVIVDEALPPGRATNAAVCVAAATASTVPGLLGPDAKDSSGTVHPGLPWAGCTVLGAATARLAEIRSKAAAMQDVHLADMPQAAQLTRVYDEYLDQVAGAVATNISYYAISIVGPRNRVDKMVRSLPLLA
jgi:hypothetical protein